MVSGSTYGNGTQNEIRQFSRIRWLFQYILVSYTWSCIKIKWNVWRTTVIRYGAPAFILTRGELNIFAIWMFIICWCDRIGTHQLTSLLQPNCSFLLLLLSSHVTGRYANSFASVLNDTSKERNMFGDLLGQLPRQQANILFRMANENNNRPQLHHNHNNYPRTQTYKRKRDRERMRPIIHLCAVVKLWQPRHLFWAIIYHSVCQLANLAPGYQ